MPGMCDSMRRATCTAAKRRNSGRNTPTTNAHAAGTTTSNKAMKRTSDATGTTRPPSVHVIGRRGIVMSMSVRTTRMPSPRPRLRPRPVTTQLDRSRCRVRRMRRYSGRESGKVVVTSGGMNLSSAVGRMPGLDLAGRSQTGGNSGTLTGQSCSRMVPTTGGTQATTVGQLQAAMETLRRGALGGGKLRPLKPTTLKATRTPLSITNLRNAPAISRSPSRERLILQRLLPGRRRSCVPPRSRNQSVRCGRAPTPVPPDRRACR